MIKEDSSNIDHIQIGGKNEIYSLGGINFGDCRGVELGNMGNFSD